MKFKEDYQPVVADPLLDDSRDNLECFGEYSKHDKICTEYCGASIRCAIEHQQNPRIDILDHLLTLDFYPAKMN